MRTIIACLMTMILIGCIGKKQEDCENQGEVFSNQKDNQREEAIRFLEPRRVGDQVQIYLSDDTGFSRPQSFQQIAQWIRPEIRIEVTSMRIINGDAIRDFNGIEFFPKLNSLGIRGSKITSLDGIAAISQSIQAISLDDSTLMDASFLTQLPNITAFLLRNAPIESIPDLSELPLKALNLSGTRVNPMEINVADGLSMIVLDNLEINTLEEVKHLFSKTEKLSLLNNKILEIDKGLSFGSVKWIGLYGNPVAEEYLASLKQNDRGSVKVDDTWLIFTKPDDHW